MTRDEEDDEGEQLDKGKGKGGQFIGERGDEANEVQRGDEANEVQMTRLGERGDEANEVRMTSDEEDEMSIIDAVRALAPTHAQLIAMWHKVWDRRQQQQQQ